MCWTIFTISTKHLPNHTFSSFFSFWFVQNIKKTETKRNLTTTTVRISCAILFFYVDRLASNEMQTSILFPYLDWIFVSPFITRKINRPIYWRQPCWNTFTIYTELMEWNVLILTLVEPMRQWRMREEKRWWRRIRQLEFRSTDWCDDSWCDDSIAKFLLIKGNRVRRTFFLFDKIQSTPQTHSLHKLYYIIIFK